MLEIKNVSKRYPTGTLANNNISFTVGAGEIVALVGPNGSGKTTLMQQILGVLKIGEGSIRIDGKEHCMDNVAYVPQMPGLYPALTVRESLMVVAKYLGLPKKEATGRVDAALEKIGLQDKANQLTYTLSGGQQKLLAFGCMLVQKATNLVLDEATSMVDIISKERIWELIQEQRKQGCAILLSSHDVAEVHKLCTRLVVLQNGEVIFSGSPQEIKNEYCRCAITTSTPEQAEKLLENGACSFTRKEDSFVVVTQDIFSMVRLLHDLSQSVSINSLQCEHPAFYDGLLSMLRKKV